MSTPSTITVSWSEIAAARQCPLKHRLAYKERWTSDSTSPALSRGILWHQVLEHHYRSIMHAQRDQIAEEVDGRIERDRLLMADEYGHVTEEQELVRWMLAGYQEQWPNDQDEWKILAVEHAAEVPLPGPTGKRRSSFVLKMKIDLVVRVKGTSGLWLVDHKSTGQRMPSDLELALDDQFGLYVWGMRQLGHDVRGCIYSAALTRKNKSKPQTLDERFARHMMYRTDPELDTIALEAYQTAFNVWRRGDDHRTPNTDRCKWGCDFTEACLASRKGIDAEDLLKARGFRQDFERH